MNTEPVAAIATVDKRRVTFADIWRRVDGDVKNVIAGITIIGTATASFVGIIWAIRIAPFVVLGAVPLAGLTYIGIGFLNAYRKAKDEL